MFLRRFQKARGEYARSLTGFRKNKMYSRSILFIVETISQAICTSTENISLAANYTTPVKKSYPFLNTLLSLNCYYYGTEWLDQLYANRSHSWTCLWGAFNSVTGWPTVERFAWCVFWTLVYTKRLIPFCYARESTRWGVCSCPPCFHERFVWHN